MNSSEAGYRYSRLMHKNLSRLQSLPLLKTALIEGKALGGGAELLTACDFRLITKSALIGFVQICVGVTPGWSGGSRLVHTIGYAKALDVLLSGRLLNANELMKIGFVNHIFDDLETDILLDKTNQWLQQFINANS